MGILIWPRGNLGPWVAFRPVGRMRCYFSDRGCTGDSYSPEGHFADPRGITICTFCYGRPDTDWNYPHQYKTRRGFVHPGGSFVYDCSRLRRLLFLLLSCPAGSLSGCYFFPCGSGHLSLRCSSASFCFRGLSCPACLLCETDPSTCSGRNRSSCWRTRPVAANCSENLNRSI